MKILSKESRHSRYGIVVVRSVYYGRERKLLNKGRITAAAGIVSRYMCKLDSPCLL